MYETDSDRLAMLEALGETVEYNGSSYWGIFDDSFAVVNEGTGEVETSAPTLLARAIDLAGVKHGSVVTVRAVAYKVIGVHPDGTGMTTIVLSKD